MNYYLRIFLAKSQKRARFDFYLILLFGVLCGIYTSATAQTNKLNEKITLKMEHTTLLHVIETIDKQSSYSFTYVQSDLEKIKVSFIQFRESHLSTVLAGLERQYNVQFLVGDGNISVKTVSAVKALAPPNESHANVGVILNGVVLDAKTGAFLIGADISIQGANRHATAGLSGEFSLKIKDSSSSVILVASMIGYATKIFEVKNYSKNIVLKMVTDSKTLEGVTVQARRRINTETTLLNERKNAAVISDGISAQNIERSASITTTQALQRVTGVTITDEKYVAIRGLGDRSVIAELNGARLSSANPDRSAVPLDLVPAGLLDNITVYKTLSPDHPADASAGIIELKTKSVPSALTVQFTSQTGTNSEVGLGGSVNSFINSDMGFLGNKIKNKDLSSDFLNLSNQYPGGLTQIQRLFIESRTSPALAAEAYRINNIMLSFDPVLATSYKKAQPDQIYTISMGNTFRVFGGHALGVVLSANYYRRTEDRYNAQLNQYSLYQGVVTGSFSVSYDTYGNPIYTPKIYSPMHIPGFISPDNTVLSKYLGYAENSGVETLSYGAIAGVTYKFNSFNEIQVQYMGSRGGETEASNLNGAYDNTGLQFPVYNQVNQLRQTYRIFNTLNLQGEHQLNFLAKLKAAAPRLSYNLSSSKSKQDEPDFRFTDVADLQETHYVDQTGVGIGSDIYSFVVGSVHGIGSNGVIGADPNGRKYRNLTETNYNAKADLSKTFTVNGLAQTLKIGGNYLYRKRDFTENILGLPGTTDSLLNVVKGDVNKLVSYQYIGLRDASGYDNLGQPRVGGFLYQIKKSPNNYSGTYETKAFYVMADLHFGEKLRVAGGVRFETTDIETNVDTTNVYNPLSTLTGVSGVTTISSSSITNPRIIYSQNYKPYYSVNLTYAVRSDMNLRLGYYTSLARPELREMTNIYEFDPFQFAVVVGNPTLINQLTRSEDARWEWFPSQGEVISASVFAKQIEHQLNKVFIYNSPGNASLYPEYPIIEFQNDPNQGYIYGVELEFRKSLGALWKPLNHFYLGANFMGAYSSIEKNADRLAASRINDRLAPSKSPVYEQPPYSLNAYIDYDNPKTGTNITTSFNVVGERLIQVQLDGTPDIYDRPAPLLDFVFSQKLGKKFLVKGFAKNILNPAFREVYAYPKNGGKFYGGTYIHHQYYKGAEFALGLSYNLF